MKLNRLIARVSLAALLSSAAVIAHSAPVLLSSKDGTTQVRGNLTSFDGENYVLETVFGTIVVSVNDANCLGEDCPKISRDLSLSLTTTPDISSGLLAQLLDGFGNSADVAAVPEYNGTALTKIAYKDGEEDFGSVDVTRTTANDAFQALLDGNTDLVMSTERVPDGLANTVLSLTGQDLRSFEREKVIALDALVPVTHPDNRVRSISLEEIGLIAAGRIRNWSELGGDDAPIRMIMPAEASSIQTTLDERIFEPFRLRVSRRIERIADDADRVAAVNDDVSAVTITSQQLAASARVVPVRQTCGTISRSNSFAVKAEEYPLQRRIYLYSLAESRLSDGAQKLLEYLPSEEAQNIVDANGLIDQSILSQPIDLQGTRMNAALLSADSVGKVEQLQTLARDLATSDRLSTTLRFRSGSATLDNKSLQDIQRIAEFAKSPEMANRKLLLIGFTDNVGRDDLNAILAQQRADVIKNLLLEAAGDDISEDRIEVTSYGPLAPVGCNDTAEGRASNRRVELWVQ